MVPEFLMQQSALFNHLPKLIEQMLIVQCSNEVHSSMFLSFSQFILNYLPLSEYHELVVKPWFLLLSTHQFIQCTFPVFKSALQEVRIVNFESYDFRKLLDSIDV
jgi:hypothetical protein